MTIKLLLTTYILFIASVAFFSHKKGFYLVWMTLLITPPIILNRGIILRLELMNLLILVSVLSELRFRENVRKYKLFLLKYRKAILLYFAVSLSVIFLSQTVPIYDQLMIFRNEIIIFVFIVQTYMMTKDSQFASKHLMWVICGIIAFNFVYCLVFEVIMQMNPAGIPLYYFLGQEDNDFLVDMGEVERGSLSFRAQTLYGHPLSLGQYMLVLIPIFLIKNRMNYRWLIIFMICVLIFLSGSRGALVPMALILFLEFIRDSQKYLIKFMFVLLFVPFVVFIIPDRQLSEFNKRIEPFVAGLMFWDDQKQKDNDMGGSSMELRIDQWNASLDEIGDNVLFGRGLGYREYWQDKHNGSVHPNLLGYESVLIYYIVERGLVGLLFFFVMIGYLYNIFKNMTKERHLLNLLFGGYLLSIIMTGVRPLTLLIVCLSASIVCSFSPRHKYHEMVSR